MVKKLFVTYGMVLALGLSTALARGWRFSTGSSGSSHRSTRGGARGSSGIWGWGGGK